MPTPEIVQELFWCYACRQNKPVSDFWTYKNSKRPHRIQSRCKDCTRKYNREVSWPKAKDTEKYKEQWNIRNKRSKAKHADRQRARQMVRRRGLKKDKCERCGGTDRLQMHHEDYSKPLEVITLCLPCHRAEDKENAPAA